MRTKLIIIGIITLIAGVSSFLMWWLASREQATFSGNNEGAPSLPTAGQAGDTYLPSATSSAATGASLMLIKQRDGSTISVLDFINNGTATPDPSNPENYYLAGLSDEEYSIGYRAPAQFFTIALEKEPLGATRVSAETFLRQTLGVEEKELCKLDYYIGTDSYTNQFFAGKNLGFSFCPGATPLPK